MFDSELLKVNTQFKEFEDFDLYTFITKSLSREIPVWLIYMI